MIYLDHCATTPLHPAVWAAMAPFFTDHFGNPSSNHAYGRKAKEAVEEARGQVAALIGAAPQEIVFTSGGTEADNLAIRAAAMRRKTGHMVTSAVEHHAVLNTVRDLEHRGFRVTYLPVDGQGLIDPEAVVRAVDRRTFLVSIMHGNNEIGTVEPIEEIGKKIAGRGVLFHTDAVQTVGKVPVNVRRLGVDLLSLSAHKINGPKGVGALFIREGVHLPPLITGGHQEGDRRGGTENVAAIVGFGKACELALQDRGKTTKAWAKLRDLLQARVTQRVSCRVNGCHERRLPHVLSLSFPGLAAEEIVAALDKEGVAVSAGSACQAGRQEVSHVITALGLSPDEARGTIRLSIGMGNTEEDICQAADILSAVVNRLRTLQGLEKDMGRRGCF